MIHSIRRLLSGLVATAALISVSAFGLVVCLSLRWSEVPPNELSEISVGQCDANQLAGHCCLYSQWNSCKNQIGPNCVNGVIINGTCRTPAGLIVTLPTCNAAAGTPAPTCAIALLTINTDTCTLNGKKNMDGSCQYVYVAPKAGGSTAQVCNCNPTFSICAGRQANPPCPTK